MKLEPFTGPGSTPSRRRFWDQVAEAVNSSRKLPGRFVTVDEHEGKGSVINIDDTSKRRAGGGETGACCYDDGTCEILSPTECSSGGGTYLGNGTDCDPNPCGEGACCYPDGSCVVQTLDSCNDAGGTFQGAGTDCDPNPCPFDCDFGLYIFRCVGVMCDTNPMGGTYTSVFDLSPGGGSFTSSGSGTEGPSDFATLDWHFNITLDGMGGFTADYGGTVTGRYGSTQDFSYSFDGTCGTPQVDNHTDRFCCEGTGECSDIIGCTDANCLLAFDSGEGFGVTFQVS